METEAIKVTCPYYINSDRLLDLLASKENGYCEIEEIEKSVTHTRSKSRGLKGELKASIFSISTERSKTSGQDETETIKTTRKHTGASLLNKTIREIEITDLATPTNSPVLFECGNIVEFTGTISQDKLGAEDYITFGFEAEAGVATKKEEEKEFDQKKARRRKKQKTQGC